MRSLVLCASFAMGLSAVGCSSHERYLVDRAHFEALAQSGLPDSAPLTLPASRVDDAKLVLVKTSALDLGSAIPVGTNVISVEARGKNPRITAGSVLTWVGTAISLVGTGLVIGGRLHDSNPIFYTGAALALFAEPIMWTGTGLWITGALRRPYEVSPAH